MKGKMLLFLAVLFVFAPAFAAKVDTVFVYSTSMNKNIGCVVVKPEGYKQKGKHYPVLYLLHGYSGNYSDWIKKVPAIKEYADRYKIFIVCPDGAFSSWYFDSPVDTAMRYETHVAKEVPAYIDAHYPTIANRNARAITGLSMGGHGGLFLGIRHAETFGACGSMSGGVDLNDARGEYDIDKRIGDTINHAENWANYSVMKVVEQMPKDTLHIIFDCGTEDFFYNINARLHQKMLQLHIPHDYIERPGQHNWDYWANALQYQLLFFTNYFSASKLQ
jgi:S-formylglutathione hydrolase FrmB